MAAAVILFQTDAKAIFSYFHRNYFMRNPLLLACLLFLFGKVNSQNPKPAPVQSQAVVIKGGTIHTATGSVIENGTIIFDKGKITYIGKDEKTVAGAKIIDATGKHIYPGFIAPDNYLGLNEIELVRSTLDYYEVGDLNPNIRSLNAYNTDSKIIPTIRTNGVLLSQCVPQGGIVSGTSSIMQLDAWNWEDAAYKADDGIHINYPEFEPGAGTVEEIRRRQDAYMNQYDAIEKLMQDAQAYYKEGTHTIANLKLESMKGLFNNSKKLFVHVNYVKGIIHAVNFFSQYKVEIVMVGATDAYQVATLLHDHNISVILPTLHRLPARTHDAIDQPFKTPFILQQAGVKFCLAVEGSWQVRNLPFMAGTAAAYGLSKEEALQCITKNTAEILGIDNTTGTLEMGKDATLFISDGDALDMKGNNVTYAFIQGREISLDNIQKQLNRKYDEKYGIKTE
jgi:imidazolonepropionase-like amidohydrolase